MLREINPYIEGYIPPPLLAVVQQLQRGGCPATANQPLIACMCSRLALSVPPGFLDFPETILRFLEQHQGEEIDYFSI